MLARKGSIFCGWLFVVAVLDGFDRAAFASLFGLCEFLWAKGLVVDDMVVVVVRSPEHGRCQIGTGIAVDALLVHEPGAGGVVRMSFNSHGDINALTGLDTEIH